MSFPEEIEQELQKRLAYPYHWGRRQSDDWDQKTNFIYKTKDFNILLQQLKNLDSDLENYAMNRWFNFWSAMAVEYLFAQNPSVTPNKNKYDKMIDFRINNIPFDHKTTVFPKHYLHSLLETQKNDVELIKWLYKNQSQEGRKHLKNRLFIVLYDQKEKQHWKLKAKVSFLKKCINTYMMSFSEDNLKKISFQNTTVYSDIIWAIGV